MSVFIDAYRFPFRNMKMSHMTADSREELHAFAERLGLRRECFQDGRHPHYDISESKRLQAVINGAVQISSGELIEIAKRLRLPNARTD